MSEEEVKLTIIRELDPGEIVVQMMNLPVLEVDPNSGLQKQVFLLLTSSGRILARGPQPGDWVEFPSPKSRKHNA